MSNLVLDRPADESRASRGRPFYLALDPDPVLAVLHAPDEGSRTGTGVVFCAPFGWDELCSYRSLRAWADALAADGYVALRMDFPGTGDSGGSPRDPERLKAWTGAVASGADWLRSAQGCERIVAIGIGLGGSVAVKAVADGAPIDDLVLWSVFARGTLVMRELRTFAQIASGEYGEPDEEVPLPPDDGSLEVAGFVLSAETVGELEQLDLTTLSLPDAAHRRVLLLGRDSLAPDRRLREHFEASGVDLTASDGPGYGKMMTHPQFAETPQQAVALTRSWLTAQPATPLAGVTTSSKGGSALSADHADLAVGEATIRETPFEFDYQGKRLVGVLAEPIAGQGPRAALCAVLLNAGAVRRIGPNRMWVETARRWAAHGVPCLRLDAVGIGDSDGDERHYHLTAHFYEDEIAAQVHAALDELESRRHASQFLVGGLCSGAYWGFHAALGDERVRSLVLVNLWSFFWSEELAAARDARRARSMLRSGAWRDVARIAVGEGQGRIGRMLRTQLRRLARLGRKDGDLLSGLDDAIDDALARLRDRHVQVLLLLSRGEPLAEDFTEEGRVERLGEWPNLRFERIPIEDHIFRPVWAQQRVSRALDDALARTLVEDKQGTPAQ